jgi:hypothetical protein
MDASQGAFINHVDNWKHCRMYLNGGAGNFDQQQHLIRKKEAAIPKNHAGLIVRRFSCHKSLWRLLLPFSEERSYWRRKFVAPRLPVSRNAPELLTFILPTRIVSALYAANQSTNLIHLDSTTWLRGWNPSRDCDAKLDLTLS